MNELSELAATITQIIKLNKFLDLPDEIDFEFEHREPVNGMVVRASTCIIDNVIYINPFRSPTDDDFVDTICHELVHIEQGHQGILSYPLDTNDYQWGDKRYPLPKSKKEYMNFPWEKDAFKRGPQIAKKVRKIMKGKYSGLPTAGQC